MDQIQKAAVSEHDTANHSRHFCMVAAKRDLNQIAALSKSPNFICRHCGRVADMEMNLCEPVRTRQAEPKKERPVRQQRIKYGTTEIIYE